MMVMEMMVMVVVVMMITASVENSLHCGQLLLKLHQT